MQTLTLTSCDRTPHPHPPHPPNCFNIPRIPAHLTYPSHTIHAQPHPYSYIHATPVSLPPRLHIEHHPVLGYRAYFTPLTPGPGNFPLPTCYSDYHPTAALALADHLPAYIEDLILYQAFQTLLALSQRFDGRAVINAFELLKENNPDDDYYLDVEAGRADF